MRLGVELLGLFEPLPAELQRRQPGEAAAVLGIGGQRGAVGLVGLGQLVEADERLRPYRREVGGETPFALRRVVGEGERFLRLAHPQPRDGLEVEAEGAAG